MRKLFMISLCIVWATLSPPVADASLLDLSTWTHQDWDLLGRQNTSHWQVLRNNSSYVYQANSAAPSAYLNNLNQSNFSMEGSFKICTPALFGTVGFVFGYQDPSHFYLFEWKLYDSESVGTGGIGFAVKRFFAPSPNNLTLSDFHSTTSTEYMEVLAKQTSIYDRLSAFSEYSFYLDYEPGFINIRLRNINTAHLLWDILIEDNAYQYGQFGFYNFQQGMALYYGFDQAGGFLEPTGNEVPVPEPGTALLLGPTLAIILLVGRRLRPQWSACV